VKKTQREARKKKGGSVAEVGLAKGGASLKRGMLEETVGWVFRAPIAREGRKRKRK